MSRVRSRYGQHPTGMVVHGGKLYLGEQTTRAIMVFELSSSEYALPAPRPLNSRLALNRLRERFDISPPSWQEALTTVMKDFTGSA